MKAVTVSVLPRMTPYRICSPQVNAKLRIFFGVPLVYLSSAHHPPGHHHHRSLRPDSNQTPLEIKTQTNATTKVLEALIDGDGEWDALVVERDTPVMDGFQIASALRDFEKARRNRASTVRAAAVEEHAKTAGGATMGGLSVEQRDTGGKTYKCTARIHCPGDGFGNPRAPVMPIGNVLGVRREGGAAAREDMSDSSEAKQYPPSALRT